MLEAMAKAGNYQGAMDVIKTYWGAMLDLGATSFWEDFNMEWIDGSAGIDEIVPEGSFPTPYGAIEIRHAKNPDGSISSTISGPEQVEIVR